MQISEARHATLCSRLCSQSFMQRRCLWYRMGVWVAQFGTRAALQTNAYSSLSLLPARPLSLTPLPIPPCRSDTFAVCQALSLSLVKGKNFAQCSCARITCRAVITNNYRGNVTFSFRLPLPLFSTPSLARLPPVPRESLVFSTFFPFILRRPWHYFCY